MSAVDLQAYGLIPSTSRIDPPFGPRDVASVLDRHLDSRADEEALVDPNRRLTYSTLDCAIGAATALFAALGVGSGDRVAASLPNCCDIVVAFMATQRLGAIWVGFNTVLSPNEKRHILNHSGARLLLTNMRGAETFDTFASDVPNVLNVLVVDDTSRDGGWPSVFTSDTAAAPTRAEIDSFAPAAIMYTSGTTGSPKGVVHSQHNMITLCAAGSTAGLLQHNGRRGVILPLTVTNLMILGPLLAFWNGAACVCGQSTKAPDVVAWIERERIETCAMVPTIIYDILQTDLDLPPYYRMASGGAPLPMPIRDAFKARHGYPLGGSYGLTEAPTAIAETRGMEAPSGASGLVLPHLVVSIRNSDDVPVPTGEVGEVCVSAVSEGEWANVYTPALGYWQDAEKSAALLRHGLLHTGDMGRLDENGWLYLADRSSELILRGGSNIYPAEVERVLYDHADVAACALVGKPDLRMGMRTVAFIQPARADFQQARMIEELTALCQTSLAKYKTPDEWIFVEEFPRNAMGKILKPALRTRLEEQNH